MASNKIIINSILVLRILTLLLVVASMVLIITDNFNVEGSKTKFSDLKSYRYVLAAGAAGALYTLIQLPFAMYHAVKEKRMIRGKFLPNFDFYGDKVISFVLASGVGVGFGVSMEIRENVDRIIDGLEQIPGTDQLFVAILEEFRSHFKKFLDRGILTSGILLGGFITMALLSVLTSINKSGKGFFG